VKLSELFAMWSAYHLKYPGEYADDVAGELDSIRGVVTQDTCACGNKESVEAELQRFLSAFERARWKECASTAFRVESDSMRFSPLKLA